MNSYRFSQLLLSVFFTFYFISCQEDSCHDLDYGDQYLEPISLTYENGAMKNAFIFKDTAGMEHRYEISIDVDLLRNNIHQDSCDSESIAITHKSEYYLRRFSNSNNTALAYAQIADFLDHETSYPENHLVDILKLSIFDDNLPPDFVSRICIMTSARQGGLDKEAYNANQYIEHDSLVLFNKTFYDVFEQNHGMIKMYYTKRDGIISFTDNSGTQLVLDRSE